jgi:hypothetical protein
MIFTNHNKVIHFRYARPDPWRFYVIRYPTGKQPVDEWALSLSEQARFALADALKDAHKIENLTDWLCFKRWMKGKLKKYKVLELRFSCGDKREYRLLGVVGDERKQMIFLLGCHHKGSVYTPTAALETAFNRARDLYNQEVTIHERKVHLDR